MANRLRVNALISLAMLNVCTLGAGVAVAALLPARLALWKIPRVAAAPVAAPGEAAEQVQHRAQPAGALAERRQKGGNRFHFQNAFTAPRR